MCRWCSVWIERWSRPLRVTDLRCWRRNAWRCSAATQKLSLLPGNHTTAIRVNALYDVLLYIILLNSLLYFSVYFYGLVWLCPAVISYEWTRLTATPCMWGVCVYIMKTVSIKLCSSSFRHCAWHRTMRKPVWPAEWVRATAPNPVHHIARRGTDDKTVETTTGVLRPVTLLAYPYQDSLTLSNTYSTVDTSHIDVLIGTIIEISSY